VKYVNFNKVIIKNFLSVGETPVCVEFNKGLNIITGNNKDKVDRRNGVGKSTIADAVYFAIFGSTLREIKKEHIVNNITQRGCEVHLEFNVNSDGNNINYKIIRKLTPTKCYLYEDDIDKTRDSIQNTTDYICNILNTTPDIFQNCVIMTINNATPFMAKKKIEKRKFIEGIFNLQVFSNMLASARSEYNIVLRDLDIECARFEEISSSLNTYGEQKETDISEKNRSRKKLLERQNINIKEIEELSKNKTNITQDQINKYNSSITKIDKTLPVVNSKIQKLISDRSSVDAIIGIKKTRRDKIGTDEEQCPVCLNKLDETHRTHIDEEKIRLEDEVFHLKDTYNKLSYKKDSADELHNTLIDKRSLLIQATNKGTLQLQEVENIKERIQHLRTLNTDIKDDLKSLNKQDNTFDKIIKETEQRLTNNQKGIDTIKKDMAKLDVIKFIVSEEGVKSYIVKKILQLFNAKLALYLKEMDSNCICIFNEYFEEEIIDEKGKLCSYFNFSGAERKNIDLACLFAFMDIRRVQGDVAFNFSIYDELFDSSLDERGVELVIDILKERIEKFNECVMVISHRKESVKLATGEVICLEKQNGVTTRVASTENKCK
jgi:DNA repair exonuclease SbcCD ATPase subunit